MKVVAINGSPKANGNTAYAIKVVFEQLESEGIETEIIHVGNQIVRGCAGCNMCAKNQDEKCVLKGDKLNEWLQIMKDADGLIFASPIYFSGVAGTMKSFMDRAFYVAGVNGSMFRHKVGASVVAVRRTGGMPAFQELNNYIHYSEMVVSTSNYWNVIHGTMPGDAEKDLEGNQIMRMLGKNMAWLLKSLNQSTVPKPEAEKKIFTNFIG